jgi:beta-aspartyl-peptidase (threonine type)
MTIADSDLMKAARAVLVIHGGAGVADRGRVTPEVDREYHAALEEVVRAGAEMLSQGASAVDVAVAAVRLLEDCPLFNAGRGSVFTEAEDFEMDAALMDGRTLAAGAVAGLKRIRNPIDVAEALLKEGRCVLLAGDGAEAFAIARGCKTETKDYFWTEARHRQLLAVRAKTAQGLGSYGLEPIEPLDSSSKQGTVGCVVRDIHGHLAAASSTGGLTNKRAGRVGDTPIIGAGCYANDRSVAVAAAGVGEVFIRAVACHAVSAAMIHGKCTVRQATDETMDQVVALGGFGGLIAVDASGEVAISISTQGMYRGIGRPGLAPQTLIYR